MADELLRSLGMRLPVIQAPMAGVSTPELAAAVSNAGGLGSLGLAGQSAAQARETILRTRSLTGRAFGVNVFCHRPPRRAPETEEAWLRYLAPLFAELHIDPPHALEPVYASFADDDALLETLLETRPALVSFHFGLPGADRLSALRGAGIRTLATATSPHEAALVEAAGVDGIVAQGIEAGGHRGVFDPDATDEGLPTAALTRRLATRTGLPVIAAGGIADGAGVRAVLQLGAVAAQLGTAFVACPESGADASYRARLGDGAATTRLSRAYSGRPARGLVNAFMEFCERPDAPRPPDFPIAYDANKRLAAAAKAVGRSGIAPNWAGRSAGRARALPAGELVRAIAAELHGAPDRITEPHPRIGP
ncbi:nitronate monooxygenase [Leucobacter weissii]|uniref:Probable nitronate monooxygenase n=1 Tax=Leucobacter weissii TaxID=1983706 RepID=A0A939MMI6_9MICO|nr:nitronate monooxygenase [Leucobacter weissii]MBO1901191.1 nitronate monooxygenase [Leucobacter weissii]